MEAEQTDIPFNYATLLDLHCWTIEQGCFFLTAYKSGFKQCEIDFLSKEISKHKRKTPESAFNFMVASAREITSENNVTPDAGAFLEFIRIYQIAATGFDIKESITPYKFISWAINKRTIIVHDDLIKWREEERDKFPTGRTSATRNALKNAQSRIAELESALAARDAEFEQARAELAALREENTALKEELERARQEASPSGMTPQQKAAQVRSEKALATWKPVIRTMIQIAVIIGKEGEKERQTPDLRVYFNEMDTTITDEQMKFFRQALPSEYKDSVGGSVGKI